MRRPLRLAALLAFCALLGVVAWSPARPEARPAEVRKLVDQLGDDDMEVREKAEKRLREIGEPALPELRKAAKAHADPDVRLRAIVLGGKIEKSLYGEILRLTGHTAPIRSVAFSKDGKKALTGGMDKTMRLWDLQTGKQVKQFEADKSWVWTVAFHPDGKHALSAGSMDKVLRLWDLQTGKEVRKFVGHTDRVYGAAFSPDGKYVLSGAINTDPTLRLWETETGKQVKVLKGHTGWVWRVAFSPDGKKALSAGCNDETARIWDVEEGKELHTLKGHSGFVVGIAFASGGKQALTSGRDGTVRLWDVGTGKEVRQFTGQKDNVECLAVSPDGKRFLAGENDAVRLFDFESGKIIKSYDEELKGPVHSVAFSPDGRRALAAGGEAEKKGDAVLLGMPK